MQLKSALTSAALLLATSLSTTTASQVEARDFTTSQYQSMVTGAQFSNSWWDQNTCNVNTQANTWSWAITIENAKSVDGSNCGASYMSKIKSQCNGPYLAWSCRYVGAAQTTAWIDINADQSCTTDKVSAALGQANAAMPCGSYQDSFGAGVLEPMGTWRADVAWDWFSWW
jgi:hypothetical protein